MSDKSKYMVLGVSFDWGKRKGLDVFQYLAEHLNKNYTIVLVGTDEKIDANLPRNIISIHRTHNQRELAEIYTAADVFVNPTREDNFPTVNIEALACGTPVITFDTGGSPEIIDRTCGNVISVDDCEELCKKIMFTCENKIYKPLNCTRRAHLYEKEKRFEEYIELYR